MLDLSLPGFMVFCCSIVLLSFLLTEVIHRTQIYCTPEGTSTAPCYLHPEKPQAFGYAAHNGPHTWKLFYPHSNGCNQSPVNIETKLAIVLQPSEPLKWSGYRAQPLSMSLANNGHTVVIRALWQQAAKPRLLGGPLTDVYDFDSMVLHWGPSDQEGSEHTLDFARFPLELQMVHARRRFSSASEATAAVIQGTDVAGDGGSDDNLVIVSFFFQITAADNPYLEQIVRNLWRICDAGRQICIPGFPLEWIFPPFEKNYYSYFGSLTQPPCCETVTWIIQPELIAISASQMLEFRKLRSPDGPILLNSRPVQKLNDRDVYFHD